jgi:diketogulonate reductase-like aldo/keto reductase
VDHLMVHYPADWAETRTGKEQRQIEWQALEDIYSSGQARSVGVSHYCSAHIDDIYEIATVPISINQVEYHVGSGDVDQVYETCLRRNITFMSFSPLCGPCSIDANDSLISGTLVTEIAQSYNVSGAQVSLRFIVQQALMPGSAVGGVIPKSNNLEHIRSNMDLFSFELSDHDMERLRNATKPAAEGGDCDVA